MHSLRLIRSRRALVSSALFVIACGADPEVVTHDNGLGGSSSAGKDSDGARAATSGSGGSLMIGLGGEAASEQGGEPTTCPVGEPGCG